jgi:large subunit ribosomal protein L34e
VSKLPRRSKRTRSRKRVTKSLPGAGQRVHYKLKAGAVQRCRICKRPLGGVPRASRFVASKLNRGRKSVQRPFGGQICSDCLKRGLRQAAKNV